MDIKNGILKNQKAIFLENEHIFAAILPDLGGKIARLAHKPTGFEFTAKSKGDYKSPYYNAGFADYDASGLDDAFPTIHACSDKLSQKSYPDHGEIWSAKMSFIMEKNCLRLYYKSPYMPFSYEKSISLSHHGLMLNYRIKNTGDSPFPCIWAFHGLMRYEEDMRIIYPEKSHAFINVLKSPQLGNINERHLINDYDFSRPPAFNSLAQVKYYLDGKSKKGRCGFFYPSNNLGVMLYYDHNILPYLGVWISAGGFRGDYNIALEPCNGFYDDIETTRKNKAIYYLKPDEPLIFSLAINLREGNIFDSLVR